MELLVFEGLSTYQIAKKYEMGQTTIRYWLRKYGLNTNHMPFTEKSKMISLNGKKCLMCGEPLFGARSHYCNDKCKSKHHYKFNKKNANPNTNERQAKVSKERKLKLIEMSGGKCVKCGYCKNYSALSFHHTNPENKTFTLDSRKLSNTNWNSILKEWEKCELLCLNCHMETHCPDNLI